MMLVEVAVKIARKISPLRDFFYSIDKFRGQFILEKIGAFLPKAPARVLDIGSAGCAISELLMERGYHIIAIDIVDRNLSKKITPVLFDGIKLPFKDGNFDTSLLISTLHHIPAPEAMILEAKRVSKRIIVFEDIFTNRLEKILTFVQDSVHNLEFVGHPHTNKTDGQWKVVFRQLNLEILQTKYFNSFLNYKHAAYLLKSRK